ncbi:MAG: hypothetical protein IPJ65_21245 [Archangiaceae bacterium]|nr:hypothetical protein [Archangiaceae bacterium]
MSRISKADVNRVLDQAAKAIIDAGGQDGRISRADIKSAIAPMSGVQKQLVDVFFKFIDNRDFKKGATVTPADVKRAVAFAKEKLIAKYDLNQNGLSKDEEKKMSLTGRLAVNLAKALKTAGAAGIDPREGMLKKWDSWFTLNDNAKVEGKTKVTPANASKVSPELAEMIVEATLAADYPGVKTLADALDAVDDSEVVTRTFTDETTGEKLLGIDFGSGGSTYGGIFDLKNNMVARIDDGEILLK